MEERLSSHLKQDTRKTWACPFSKLELGLFHLSLSHWFPLLWVRSLLKFLNRQREAWSLTAVCKRLEQEITWLPPYQFGHGRTWVATRHDSLILQTNILLSLLLSCDFFFFFLFIVFLHFLHCLPFIPLMFNWICMCLLCIGSMCYMDLLLQRLFIHGCMKMGKDIAGASIFLSYVPLEGSSISYGLHIATCSSLPEIV